MCAPPNWADVGDNIRNALKGTLDLVLDSICPGSTWAGQSGSYDSHKLLNENACQTPGKHHPPVVKPGFSMTRRHSMVSSGDGRLAGLNLSCDLRGACTSAAKIGVGCLDGDHHRG